MGLVDIVCVAGVSETPDKVLETALKRSRTERIMREFKKTWPGAQDFALIVTRHLMDLVPDSLSGYPLLYACIRRGLHSTSRYMNDSRSCNTKMCLIENFIEQVLVPIPQVMIWRYQCAVSNDIWNPKVIGLNEWIKKHPYYNVERSGTILNATESEQFRNQLKDCLVTQSVQDLIAKGDCLNGCLDSGREA